MTNHNTNEIDTIIEAAENLTEEVSETDNYRPKLWTIKELIDTDFGSQEWLIEGLIPMQTITIMSGDPESYKTWLTIEMAKNIASGKPFLSKFKVTPMPVLFVDEENSLRLLQKRYKILKVPEDLPIYYLSTTNFKITDPTCIQTLKNLIQENHIGIVVFDSLLRIHTGDENSARDMGRVYDELKKIRAMGVSVLITHHHRKQGFGPRNVSQNLRGSTDILACVDVHIAITTSDKVISFVQNKLRGDEKINPFNIKVIKEDSILRFEFAGAVEKDELAYITAKEIILRILHDESDIDRQAIDLRVKNVQPIGNVAIGKALSDLIKENLIKVRTGQRNKKFYSILEPETEETELLF